MPLRSLLPALLVLCALAASPRTAGGGEGVSQAASAFLQALDDEQREACRFEFSDAERRNWRPTPMGDAGVSIAELDEAQRGKLRALLASVLSEDGLATVDGVRVLEGILVAMEAERGRPSRFHGVERYFVTLYGDPAGATPWGWRIEGHHLSMTFTCLEGGWVAHGPLFVGAQPARVKGGEHDGMRLLGDHDDAVRALIESLDADQRGEAVSARGVPGNVQLVPGNDQGFDDPGGLAASELTDAQRALLRSALRQWTAWLRPDLEQAELRRIEAGLGRVRLLWIGAQGVDEPHYWRLVGPHFALEYAAPEQDPDHVHALWRDTENDFGGELLRRHLEEHHGGGR